MSTLLRNRFTRAATEGGGVSGHRQVVNTQQFMGRTGAWSDRINRRGWWDDPPSAALKWQLHLPPATLREELVQRQTEIRAEIARLNTFLPWSRSGSNPTSVKIRDNHGREHRDPRVRAVVERRDFLVAICRDLEERSGHLTRASKGERAARFARRFVEMARGCLSDADFVAIKNVVNNQLDEEDFKALAGNRR